MAKEASRMNDDTMAAPSKAPAAPLRVNPVLFKRTEHATTDWHHIADPRIAKAEDLLEAKYWIGVAERMGRHDTLRVIAADGTWEVRAIVESSGPLGAELTIEKLIKRKPKEGIVLAEGEYVLRWMDEARKYAIIRIKDQHVVSAGHATEGVAKLAFQQMFPRTAA